MGYIKTKNFRASMSGFGSLGARTKMTSRGGHTMGAVRDLAGGLVDDPLDALAAGVKKPATVTPSQSLNALRTGQTSSAGGGLFDTLKNLVTGLFGGSSAPAQTTPVYTPDTGMSTTTKLLIGAGVVGGVILLKRRK